MNDSKNSKLLMEFREYCVAHPELRFWQALRNWAGVDFIFVRKDLLDPQEQDTFYWEEKDK